VCASPLMCRTHRANTLGCDDIYTNYDTIKGEDTAKKKERRRRVSSVVVNYYRALQSVGGS
jgi:hypothetical protein